MIVNSLFNLPKNKTDFQENEDNVQSPKVLEGPSNISIQDCLCVGGGNLCKNCMPD